MYVFNFLHKLSCENNFLFSIHFKLSNKFFSLKNRTLFLETENKGKKKVTKLTYLYFLFSLFSTRPKYSSFDAIMVLFKVHKYYSHFEDFRDSHIILGVVKLVCSFFFFFNSKLITCWSLKIHFSQFWNLRYYGYLGYFKLSGIFQSFLNFLNFISLILFVNERIC